MNVVVREGNFGYGGVKKQPSMLYQQAINFSLSSGEIMTILGANGAGKTTLLRCLVGLLSWSSGESIFDGIPLKQWKREHFWKQVSYVPPARRSLFDLTIEEYVVLGRAAYIGTFQQPSTKDRELAQQTLERVGIAHLAHKFSHQVSSGELQLASIARTLISNPKLLLLDEPESHLDIQKQVAILETIKRLAKEDGITCIINTHYPSHAFYLADKVLLMGKGRSTIYGSTEQVMQVEHLSSYFNIDLVKLHHHCEDKTIEAIMPIALAREQIESVIKS